MGVIINYKNNEVTNLDETGRITLNTANQYMEANLLIDYTQDSSVTLNSITITNPPNKTLYYTTLNEVFDPTGMEVTISVTSDGTNYIFPVTNYTYPTSPFEFGDTTATISYTFAGQTVTTNQTISTSSASTTLNDNSWAVISSVAQSGDGDTYWDIGDCKEIILNGAIGDGLTLSNFTTYVFILDFNHVDNGVSDNNIIFGGFKTALSNGTDICLCDSKFNSGSTSGKYFNLNHVGTSSQPYNTNYGGWKGCDFRYDILGATQTAPSPYNTNKTTSTTGTDATTSAITNPVSNTLMAALPFDFRNVLKLRAHYVDNKGNNSNVDVNVTAVVDTIALLAEFEIFGSKTYANQYEQNHQQQMTYYASGNSKIKYIHNDTSTAANWWGCSPRSSNMIGFCGVSSDDTVIGYTSKFSYGLAPAFKV